MLELIKIIENYSEFENMCETTSFKNDLELSSFDVVCIIDEIDSSLGVKLQPRDFAKHKTLGEMTEYIAQLKA